ncbi:MAG: hypothetical protein ACYT04_81655, partial [Nostoc sp.]
AASCVANTLVADFIKRGQVCAVLDPKFSMSVCKRLLADVSACLHYNHIEENIHITDEFIVLEW